MNVPKTGVRALLAQHKTGLGQLVKFALVGGSGALVNMLVVICFHKVSGHSENDVWLGLPVTDFNIRWYHIYVTTAFIVANLWNFQINRHWTFKTHGKAPWLKEFLPFFAVGVTALLIGLGVLTLLMKPESPLFLLPGVLDGTTGFRTRLYWATLIQIIVTTPISFALNRLWTFRVLRKTIPELADVVDVVDAGDPTPTRTDT